MIIPVYNQKGENVSEYKLNPDVFEVKAGVDLVHQVVVAQMANARQAIAHTKGRGEVRGGGKKPWKQKGTGRARHGSSRSPIWVGGGVTFGPTKDRNFSLKINKKMKQKALLGILSDKVESKSLIILDKLEINEPKTKKIKEVVDAFKKIVLGEDKKEPRVLLAVDKKNENMIKASGNLPKLTLIQANSLNVREVLANKYLILELEGLKELEKRFK